MNPVKDMKTLKKDDITLEEIDEMVDEELSEDTGRVDLVFLMAQLLKWQRDCLLDYVEYCDRDDICTFIEEIECLFDPDGSPSENSKGWPIVPFCEYCNHRGNPATECMKHLWEAQMERGFMVEWGNWNGDVDAFTMRKRINALRCMRQIKSRMDDGPSEEELRKIEEEEANGKR